MFIFYRSIFLALICGLSQYCIAQAPTLKELELFSQLNKSSLSAMLIGKGYQEIEVAAWGNEWGTIQYLDTLIMYSKFSFDSKIAIEKTIKHRG